MPYKRQMFRSLTKHASIIGIYHLVHIHIQYFIKQHQAALILDRSCYIIRRIVYGSTILPLVIAVDNSVTIEIPTSYITCGSLHHISILIGDVRYFTIAFRAFHYNQMAFSVVFHLPSKLIGIGSTSVVY